MMKTIHYITLLLLLIAGGCEQVNEGFISENVNYSQNPFNVTQGQVVLSNSIVTDGSTLPLKVKLVAVRNKLTGAPATELVQEYETKVYTSEITQKDTTFALVQSKIETKMWPVFNINEVGGQLQFSPQTINVPTGEYTIDVEVSNDSGKKLLKDVCTIKINTGAIIPTLYGQVIAYRQKLDENDEPYIAEEYPAVTISVTRQDSESNTIAYTFVDQDGDVIDPVKYGFTERVVNSASDYKFSFATPWSKGNPESVTAESVGYSFPVGPFPYSWIAAGRHFRFSYIPAGDARAEFMEKTGDLVGFDVLIDTNGFKLTYDGAYTITVKCGFDI